MLIEKISSYFRSVTATGKFHLSGLPFIPKGLFRLTPFNRQAYNTFLTEAVGWNLGKSPVIYDVGANNGDFALAFQAAYPEARLYLFEPLERHLDHLRQLKETGAFNWTIYPNALGSRSEELEIEVPDGFEDASSLLGFSEEYLLQNPHSAKTRREICKVRSLDELMSENQPATSIDLLKIDVEGFEFAVLEGANNTLRRVANIVVEVSLLRHSEGDYCPVARMVSTLEKSGLRLFRMQPTVTVPGLGKKPLEYDLYFTRSKEVIS
jgi:FkbM family methyltransferase